MNLLLVQYLLKNNNHNRRQNTMDSIGNSNIAMFFILIIITFFFISTHATTFQILNECPYTVWAAADPGGGRRLERGQTWTLNMAEGASTGRIWGRTKCNFDSSGRGHCETGDCGGLLQCQGWGQPPNTIAEFALKPFNNRDFFDISLLDGFNIPMVFNPTTGGCRGMSCTADINSQCPTKLRAPGGCNNPCTVFQTNEYCCYEGFGTCGPTEFSRFFKKMCPDAYNLPPDDSPSTFSCPNGTNYRVVFCPTTTANGFPVDKVGSI